jgi:hypothetical protein
MQDHQNPRSIGADALPVCVRPSEPRTMRTSPRDHIAPCTARGSVHASQRSKEKTDVDRTAGRSLSCSVRAAEARTQAEYAARATGHVGRSPSDEGLVTTTTLMHQAADARTTRSAR